MSFDIQGDGLKAIAGALIGGVQAGIKVGKMAHQQVFGRSAGGRN